MTDKWFLNGGPPQLSVNNQAAATKRFLAQLLDTPDDDQEETND